LCSRCLSAEVFASLLMGGLQRHSELCHNARLCWSRRGLKVESKDLVWSEWFVNKIQPISVGVWRRGLQSPLDSKRSWNRSEVHFNSVLWVISRSN